MAEVVLLRTTEDRDIQVRFLLVPQKIAMAVQRRFYEMCWVAPLRGSIPQSQQIDCEAY